MGSSVSKHKYYLGFSILLVLARCRLPIYIHNLLEWAKQARHKLENSLGGSWIHYRLHIQHMDIIWHARAASEWLSIGWAAQEVDTTKYVSVYRCIGVDACSLRNTGADTSTTTTTTTAALAAQQHSDQSQFYVGCQHQHERGRCWTIVILTFVSGVRIERR